MDILIPGLQLSIVLQSAIFAILLTNHQRLSMLAGKLTIALMAILSAHMLLNLGFYSLVWPVLPKLASGFGMFYGPIIFFSLNAMIYRGYTWRTAYFYHFLPGILLGLAVSLEILPSMAAPISIFLSIGGYLFAALVNYVQFRRVIKHTQSAEDYIGMNWAAILLGSSSILLAINVLSVLLAAYSGESVWNAFAEVCLFAMLILMLNLMVLKGLLEPSAFKGISKDDEDIANASQVVTKSNQLDSDTLSRLDKVLSQHMTNARPYLDPMFNLQSLARQLGERPRHLSAYINHQLKSNFADFVNQYRIAEVKSQLAIPDYPKSIIEIAYDCGFCTKSNFNRAFKKHVGMTPSEYKVDKTED